jgi:hypothetical protein
LEGRWATLAVRAQRDGVLDYREYESYDEGWAIKETLLFNSLENSLMAEHCRMIIPVLQPDARTDMFERLINYEMPWLLEDMSEASASERLINMYNQLMDESDVKNKRS